MEVNIYKKQNATIVKVCGKLDANTPDQVQEKIITSVIPGCKLVFDMSKCVYISSTGLRILLIVAKQLAKIGGRGVFANLQEEVREVMVMTGFDNILVNYGTIPEAIAAVQNE